MANLTFQDVMNFYPSNNKAVYAELKSAVQSSSLTPFVGAGLSVFCGYKLWPDVLKELAGFIPDDEPREAALEMIRQNEFLDAAEHIHKHYRPMMRRLLGLVNYSKIDDCPDDRLYSSAAWVLPKLFGSRPMMTTNFDGVLEYVFAKQNRSFERIVEPCDPSILNQVRQKDAHGLFKLHGDIGRETTSMDRLVFTRTQYDNVYKGDLIDELKQWYQNQTLLFLGCSLAMDKTMEVLRAVVEKHPAIRHFAIVACKSDQRSDLLDQFADLGIDAIFYDDSNHDAVRVILENLLYETDQDAYQQLDEEMCRFVGPIRRDDVLMYNAGRIKYVGRKDELSALEQFCESASTNSWWAVTGPGGMGKSRLVYEFTNAKKEAGWQVRWFSRDQYDQLDEYQLPAEDTIVVLDDVQADIQTVGNWLKSMRQHRRRNRLRILLLERDGKDFASADWLRLLRSGTPYSDPLARWCHGQTFLHLQPLEDDDLKNIMADCAHALGKQIDSDALLTALIQVDRELQRPLYALAVTEVACRGEDPIHWTSEQILDEMLNRELIFHYESLQYIIGTVPTHTEQLELEMLMARCCVHGHLRFEEVTRELYPCLSTWMDRMSAREFFRCLGLLQAEGGREILRMNCPDLIREHLVLRLALEQGQMELLLPEMWQEDEEQISFLSHLLDHQQTRLLDATHLWETVLKANPDSSEACTQYAGLLWDLTYCSQIHRASAAERLDQLYHANPNNPRIRTAFAAGISNNSLDLNTEGCIDSVRQLTELYEQYPTDIDIAQSLAASLSALAFWQDEEDCTKTVNRLTQLTEAFPGDHDFALELARGLSYLAYEQDGNDCSKTVERLAQLVEDFPADRDFAVELANGLRCLACEQDLIDCSQTVNRLTQLADSFPDDRDFALQLAIGLRCLASMQSLDNCAETVKQLAQIADTFPSDKDFAVELAVSLSCLAYEQDLDNRAESIKHLEQIAAAFPGDKDLALPLACGLNIMTFQADAAICNHAVSRLEQLCRAFPRDKEFADELASALVNLALAQSTEETVRKALEKSSKIQSSYPDDTNIQLCHAKTWFNLTLVQKEADIPATLASFSDFLRTHTDVIPEFKEALIAYLSEHPDHTQRYRPLLEL